MRFILFILLFVFAQSSYAFRCGNKLVSEGDTRYEVKSICGEPSDVITRTGYVTRSGAVATACPESQIRVAQANNPTSYMCVSGAEQRVAFEVQIEEWLFDFGHTRLMRRVTFENGIVVKIESLGHGH